jgi:hypothetical protein
VFTLHHQVGKTREQHGNEHDREAHPEFVSARMQQLGPQVTPAKKIDINQHVEQIERRAEYDTQPEQGDRSQPGVMIFPLQRLPSHEILIIWQSTGITGFALS